MSENKPTWETVNEEHETVTERLKINGGCIYHVSINNTDYAATFFVPESDKCNYHDEYLVKVCQRCIGARPYKKIDSSKVPKDE